MSILSRAERPAAGNADEGIHVAVETFKTKQVLADEAKARAQVVMDELVRLQPALNPLLARLQPGVSLVEDCPKCGAKLTLDRPGERIYVFCETPGCLHFEQQPQH